MKNLKKPAKKEGPAPNIQFVGRVERDGVRSANNPLPGIRLPFGRYIKLPDDQFKPFHHENAGEIIAMYPHLYKEYKSKGR